VPESNTITVSNHSQEAIRFDVEHYAHSVCSHLNLSEVELDLTFINGDKMIEMNTQYKNHHYDTDILTFDLSDEDGHTHGDIYISVTEAKKNAQDYGQALDRELKLYIIHGILHLLGYDDTTEEDKAEMDAAQMAILEAV